MLTHSNDKINLFSSSFSESNDTLNIDEAYTNLLGVIAEMQIKLGPTAIGLRAPKERLLRDIAHARVLVRECILALMRDNDQEQQWQQHQYMHDE